MPKSDIEAKFDGPIPGENYTSDTRNYPWHRPPDLTDYDEIVEHILETISDEYVMPAVMSTLAAGATLASVVDYLLLTNIGKGKFPIDMGILVAGPVARYLQIMADDFGVDYDMGLDDEFAPMPINLVKAIKEAEETKGIEFEPTSEPDPIEETGLGMAAGPAPIEEQDAMLGYTPDEMNEGAI